MTRLACVRALGLRWLRVMSVNDNHANIRVPDDQWQMDAAGATFADMRPIFVAASVMAKLGNTESANLPHWLPLIIDLPHAAATCSHS